MAKLVRFIKQLLTSNSREALVKFVGTDRFQNKFYERLPGNQHYNSARRFYEPADYSNVRLRIDPSWEAWLRGTRKDPPTLEETLAYENRRQQLEKKPVDMSPESYGRASAQGRTSSFPIRNEYEINPGVKRRENKTSDDY